MGQLKIKMARIEDFTTIYILGNASSGKTTLINRVMDKAEVTTPTLGLDYTFIRRTTQNLDQQYGTKEICSIWELGGDAAKLPDLIETPVITNRALDKMAIFVVLDLSVPEKIWFTFDIILKQLKKGITRALADNLRRNKEDTTKKLEENIVKRLGIDFADKTFVDPFPLPVVLICTKFDLFQNFEPERRKVICRVLRLASHRLGASLNFISKNDVTHSRRVRELFTHYAFGAPFPKEMSQDLNKGMMIPHGGDSYDQIWPGQNPSQFTFDYFKHLYESQIGKSSEKELVNENPAEDPNFREPQIDSQRNMLLEELRMLEESFRDSDMSDIIINTNN